MPKILKKLFLLGFLLLLVACGGTTSNEPNNPRDPDNPSNPANSLTGTLLAPAGGDVINTVLVACFVRANTCDVNSENTQGGTVSSNGSSFNYQFSDVATGSYAIFAFKDVNNDGDFGDGEDYQGCYGDGGNCAIASPPASNLNVQLETQAEPPPSAVPGSISGTLFFPGRAESDRHFEKLRETAQTFATRPLNQATFRPGEVIVKFRSSGLGTLADDEPLRNFRFAGQSLQRTRRLGLEQTSLYKANLGEAQTLALIASLNARSDIEYAEPNYIMHAMKVPNDSFYGVQWHYPAMNLENAWDIEDGTSNPVTVAVVDTGELNHPDLAGVQVGGYDFISITEISGDGDGRDPDPTDEGGDSGFHGGHVAGTIAARTNNGEGLAGVSWGAKLVNVRVLGINGSGTLADIIDGTAWAGGETVQGIPANPNPAKVINLSLGGERPCSSAEEELFATLKSKGIIVVVAAGNNNTNAGFFSPASCNNVITVGATGPTGERAPYSNFGPDIDVMATGGDIQKLINFEGRQLQAGVWSTLKDASTGEFFFGSYQGTSMAAPHIAGIAALMLSKEPTLTPDQVLARLVDSSTPLSSNQCGRSSSGDCGAGLVDAAKALTSTGSAPPPDAPPPPTAADIKTYVIAFYCANFACNDFNLDLSGLVELSNIENGSFYQILGLSLGSYAVGAFQDLDGNGDLSDGEPFGVASNLVFLEGQGASGVDIRLEPFSTSSGDTLSRSIQISLNQAAASIQAQRFVPLELDFEGLKRFFNE